MNWNFNDLTQLLKDDIKPALGVTEIGALALASSRAYDAIGGDILKISLTVNGGLFKNAFACAIPGTQDVGNELALALGAVAGDWKKDLEVLSGITEDDIASAKAIVESGLIEIHTLDEEPTIHVEVTVTTDLGSGSALIKKGHTNIVKVQRNEEILEEKQIESHTNEAFDLKSLKIENFFRYAEEVDASELDFLEGLITVNKALSSEGSKGVGLKLSGALQSIQPMESSFTAYAQSLTCNALDARLAGLPHAAMSVAGSGSHGILASLPVIAFAEFNDLDKEKTYRALALSALITIYIKAFSGKLSPLCGCVLGGGSGASGAITYLLGGNASQVGDAINNMAANLTGMICDGGSVGCSLKGSAGVHSLILSAYLAMENTSIPPHHGIVGQNVEETIQNIGKISAQGMAAVDPALIAIMKDSEA